MSEKKFMQWFVDNLVVSKFPTSIDIEKGEYEGCSYIVNVSDIFDSNIDRQIRQKGIKLFWFPLGEAFGMALESFYGALRILWQAEEEGEQSLLHCHTGKNRSVMIADAYYFLRTGKHRQKKDERLPWAEHSLNKLIENINDVQLPGLYRIEEFLSACKSVFKNSAGCKGAPLDWVKHETLIMGTGFKK